MSGMCNLSKNLRDKRKFDQLNNGSLRAGSVANTKKSMTVNELSKYFRTTKNYNLDDFRSGKYPAYTKDRSVLHKNVGPGPIGNQAGQVDINLK